MKHKYLCLFFAVTILHANAFSQPTIAAQKTIGGNRSDFFQSLDLTRDGGLIAAGYSNSHISGEKTESVRGLDDYWVVKLNSLGKIEWDKTIGGKTEDYLTSVQQTADGGYILGGHSDSRISGEKTENSRGSRDYWIVKLDDTGNIEWNKTIGGSGLEELIEVKQTADGGYILGGHSSSGISGEKTETSRGENDYWIVKVNSTGNIEWDKTLGANGTEYFSDIQQTSDGGYILGGASYSGLSGDKTENNRCHCTDFSSADYWIVKLDASGKILWDKTIGGSGTDFFRTVRQTVDGGFILGGQSDSNISGEKTDNNRCGCTGTGSDAFDYWLVKITASGVVEWDKTFGGTRFEGLGELQQTSDCGYIVGCMSSSDISGEKTEDSRGLRDYWIVKLNRTGNIEWDKTIGGTADEYFYSIREIRPNQYIAGGASDSKKNGDKTDTSRGSWDYWLVALQNKKGGLLSGTSLNKNAVTAMSSSSNFKAYPNPVKDILHIQITGKAVITLTDQSGKPLHTVHIENNGNINVSQLPAGLYYLKNNTTGAVQKLIISK